MKSAILLSLAALAVAVLGVSDAEAWWNKGPELNQKIFGSSLTVEVDDEGNTQVMLNLIAKGQPGSAHLDSVAVYGPVLGPVDGCPDGTIGANVVSQNAVETFSDGSLLTFLTTDGVLCTADGVVFTADVVGVITGGTRRFEDASGSFEASVETKNSGLSGTLTADFD